MGNRVVITGANRGIGLELARVYRDRGWQVVGLCRQSSSELEALADAVISGIDVSDVSVGDRVREALQGQSVNLLINNAGILRDEVLGSLDFASILEQFQVNTLGPLRITEALLGQMTEGARVALITSRMGSIADNSSGGRYGYRMSKAALNAAGMSLARDLQHRGIAVALLHPGYVATEMVGGRGDVSPQQAATRLAERIDGLTLENSGTFWHANGQTLPW